MREAPEITKEIAAVPLGARTRVLEAMRGPLRRMWRDRNVKILREAMPHFVALDWLVRFSRTGQVCSPSGRSCDANHDSSCQSTQ